MGAGGSIMEGFAGKSRASYEAQMLKNNARIDEKNAEIASASAGRKEESQRREARQQTGSSLLALAEAGVASGGGTSGDELVRQNQREAEMGALETRYSGNVEYTSLLNQAQQKRADAKMKKTEGKQALIGGFMKAGAGLLTSGAFG